MKKINIKVTLLVPDDFEANEASWDLEDAIMRDEYEYSACYMES